MSGKTIFVDTSGFFALLDGDDQYHHTALEKWNILFEESAQLITTNYVRLECWALLQSRLGAKAAVAFQDHVLPVCQIYDVSETEFQEAVARWRINYRKKLSLVDLTSFCCMHRLHIREVLAFDKHFIEQGFHIAGSS